MESSITFSRNELFDFTLYKDQLWAGPGNFSHELPSPAMFRSQTVRYFASFTSQQSRPSARMASTSVDEKNCFHGVELWLEIMQTAGGSICILRKLRNA